MDLSSVIFYLLTFLIVASSVAVIMLPNPIHSALSLAVTMVSLGFVYFLLEAYFIAGVQLIVYAGAVMVLFVMVLMLFDLKHETQAISGGFMGALIKLIGGGAIAGFLTWAIRKSSLVPVAKLERLTPAQQIDQVKVLAARLFTQYVFAFEALGVLLLLIAVGVVAASRSRGGTHARD